MPGGKPFKWLTGLKKKREIRGSGGELWGPDTDKDYDVLGGGTRDVCVEWRERE